MDIDRELFLWCGLWLGMAMWDVVAFTSFGVVDTVKETNAKREALERRLTPVTANVLGAVAPETYYDISPGDRFYLRIDGKSFEEHFRYTDGLFYNQQIYTRRHERLLQEYSLPELPQ